MEVIPARELWLGVIREPLWRRSVGGGKYNTGRRSSENFQREVEKNKDKLERYEALCRELGEPPAAVALAWLLTNPAVTAPIIGPRTLDQLESAVRATEIKLDAEVLAKLDEIFPGPGEPAPKAYAW